MPAAENGVKVCSECEREFPATEEFFYRNESCLDGLRGTCKECHAGVSFGIHNPNKVWDPPEDMLYCSSCFELLPRTVRFFNKGGNTKGEWRPQCKRCGGGSYEVHYPNLSYDIPDGEWYCKSCDRILPLDREHFFESDSSSGFVPICKECSGVREGFGIHRPNFHVDENKRICKSCSEEFPLDEDHYYMDSSNSSGYSYLCKSCTLDSNERKRKVDSWGDILEEFEYRCAYCGEESGSLHQEHVIPRSEGGPNTPDNVVPACLQCNYSKGASNVREWYTEQEFYDKSRLEKVIEHCEDRLSMEVME